jgi:predicted esterase
MVSGAVSVAGYLPEALWDASMAPTVGLHGTEDKAVPYERTKRYWTTMETEGAPITYRAFPGVGHGVTSSVSRAWHDALRPMVG